MSSNQKVISKQVNVHVIKRDGKHQTQSIVPRFISCRIGGHVVITPHDYLPKGYYIDHSDQDQVLHVNSNHQIVPNQVSFVYDRQGSTPQRLGLITVHYQDSEHLGHDVNSIRVHKHLGQPFPLNKYKHNLPAGTYFIGVARGAERFEKQSQDVVILVRHFLRAVLVFEDPQQRVIQKRPLLAHYTGSKIPYTKLEKYVPAGYQFVKWGTHRQTLHSGDVDVMIIRKAGRQPSTAQQTSARPQPNSAAQSTGEVLVNYADHGQVIDRHVATGQLGKPFNLDFYCDHLPSGYRFVELVNGADVRQFTKGLQVVWIEITH